MTDEKDDASNRVDTINKALNDTMQSLGDAVTQNREPTPQEITRALGGLLTVAGAIAVSLTEIAAAVNELAAVANRDYKAAVEAAAEQQADVKEKERVKRSYIGMPK